MDRASASYTVTEKAFAKVNLFLEIIARRPDGYHEIGTLFQTVEAHDTLEGRLADSGNLELEYSSPQPYPVESDLVLKAALLLQQQYGVARGAKLFLHKRLPLGGGLGGGSADAAATLRLLNRLWNLGLSWEELEILGASLGADVAFLVRGGTALAEGVGNRLFPVEGPRVLPGECILLATPPCEVPTREAYGGCRPSGSQRWNEFRESWNSSYQRGLQFIPVFNRFEETVFCKYPPVKALRDQLLQLGASKALLSGSGSTVFGVFSQESAANRVLEYLMPDLRFGVVTQLRSRIMEANKIT